MWYLWSVNEADPQALEVVLDQTLGPPGTEALMAKMSTVQRMTEEAAEKGRQEGHAHSLVKLLTHRFKKPVPAQALARIRGASVAELESWTERALEAETLDDALR